MGFKLKVARKSVWQLLNKIDDPKLSTLRKFAAATPTARKRHHTPAVQSGKASVFYRKTSDYPLIKALSQLSVREFYAVFGKDFFVVPQSIFKQLDKLRGVIDQLTVLRQCDSLLDGTSESAQDREGVALNDHAGK
jgi:hypothetical protein